MRTAASISTICVALASTLLPGCGGTPAEAVRPADPTASAALGDSGSCHKIESYGEPLVVDWKPEQRSDLEEVMHDGVAVVSYSCNGIKLLKQCKLDGTYGFLGMTKREQVVRLQNADEVRANLPLSGIKIAGDIGGDMQRGATLDIALVTIGKRRTTWKAPTRADLKGDCAEATHFVRGAMVGAFALETGTRAEIRTAAQVFGAGASGQSGSAKQLNDKEGDPTDCAKATPDATSAPGQCGAAVRVELVAIGDAPSAKPAASPPGGRDGSAIEVMEEPCPEGLVFVEGKCAPPSADKPHQCEPGDLDGCSKQCDRGHAGSCGALGAIYQGRTHEFDKALVALKKGCDGGDVRACVNEGEMTLHGLGTKADPAAAAPLFDSGCNQGDAIGCAESGRLFHAGTGVTRDDGRAATLFRKACDGGQASACGELGVMTRDGAGVTKDEKAAGGLLKRACDGSDARACNVLGAQKEGTDAIAASIFYQRGCFASGVTEAADACIGLGRVLQAGPMANADRSKSAYEMACDKQNAVGCASLKLVFGGSRPVVPDVAQQTALQSTCNGGNARACATLGVLQAASGNAVLGKQTLERACTMNDQWACAMKSKVH